MPESTSTRVLLANVQFRRLFFARTISNIGNGVAPIAIAFGVLSLPGATPTSLSIVLAAQAIPLVLVLPVGGVVADRLGRAKVIAITDLILSAFVMLTAALFLTGTATVPLLALIGAISGCLNALWWPAMSGLVPEVVDDEHLQPANAFVSVASNAGLIAGNAIGGVLVALIGSGWAIAVDSVSFIIAGLLVFSMRDVSSRHSSGESTFADLAHGWRVFWSYRWVVVIVGAFSFVGAHATLLPGTRLGRGSIVSAYSMVSGEFPDFAILAGQPAKQVGDTRNMDARLLKEHPDLAVHYQQWAGSLPEARSAP